MSDSTTVYILVGVVVLMAGCNVVSAIVHNVSRKYYRQMLAVKDAQIALLRAQVERLTTI